ncbi:unnamed protein product [Sphagnum jensenii]|uniref:Uncharacterized protein n=1 Tax=Sphagnum jensenii TaxID=128206 RepID=A0ABP1AIV6_9BRYO
MQCNWLNVRNQNFSLWKIFSSLLRGSRIGDPDSLNIELWCVFFHGMQSGKAKNQITPVESRDYQKSNIIHSNSDLLVLELLIATCKLLRLLSNKEDKKNA